MLCAKAAKRDNGGMLRGRLEMVEISYYWTWGEGSGRICPRCTIGNEREYIDYDTHYNQFQRLVPSSFV